MTSTTLRGQPAAPGAALGPAWTRNGAVAVPTNGAGAEEQVRRGLELAAAELAVTAAALRAGGHAADAEIVEANELMATDATLVEEAAAAARSGLGVAAAIATAVEPHAAALAALADPMLAARAADLRAVARRAGELGTGVHVEPPEGAILLADELGPGEVAAWARRVAAIVLAGSGTTAHAAIVARSLGVPLVTAAGAEILEIPEGEPLAVDGDRGLVLRRPGQEMRSRIEERVAAARLQSARDRAERRLPAATVDGRRVCLLANASSVTEVEAALDAGAEGVGLIRSELAFLDADAWPDEAAHAEALAPVLALLAERIATVRTLDFGGDKTPPFLAGSGAEALLGPRGIRLQLAHPEALRAQLRGVLRVAGSTVLRILLPMVTDPGEVDAVRALMREAHAAVAPDQPEPLLGAMIEVPAAAVSAHAIARRCDFLSIGTNDLVQYTLAVDREQPSLAARAVAHHPAVLRLVSRVVTAAAAAGIPVEVCGEAAGDPDFLPLLVGLGVDELSVSPARLAETRRLVRSLSGHATRTAVDHALRATTPAEIAAAARAALDA